MAGFAPFADAHGRAGKGAPQGGAMESGARPHSRQPAKRPGGEQPIPLWVSSLALGGGVAFALMASAGAPPAQSIALLTGAAAAGGLGVFGFAERLTAALRARSVNSVERFAEMFEQAPEATALVDRAGRIRSMNAVARRNFSSIQDLPPTRAEALLFGLEDAKGEVFRMLRDAMDGAPVEREIAFPQGPVRKAAVSVWPVGSGFVLWRWRASAFVSAADARAASGEAHAGEAPAMLGGRGFTDAEIAWFRIGAKGRIIASNEWFERWISGGPAEARFPSFHTVFPEAAGQMRGGVTVEGLLEATRMVSGPEGPRTVSIMLAPAVDGSGVAGIAVRRTERATAPVGSPTRAANAIEALDSAKLFEDAPIGVVVLSAQGRILQLNAAADKLLTADQHGRSSELDADQQARRLEPLNAMLSDWAHPDDRADVVEQLGNASAGLAGAGPAFETRLIIGGPAGDGARPAPDAAWRATQCRFSRVDVGENRLLVGFLIDAGEQRGIEQSFIQGQRLQAVGKLAGGIAHDFNNILTVILGCCESLLSRHTVDDPDFEELTDIDQSAQRAARMVRQLLAFSRRQQLAPETANVTELVSDLSFMLNRLIGDEISLQQDLSDDLWPVQLDIGQFQQVITNLVVNARDAMDGRGGRILIRTANETADTERPGLNFAMPPGEYVRVEVSDTGSGIPEDVIERIFDPYFTTKDIDKGTGLGLATVYGIIKQTGGYIFVDSRVGEGTTFRIFLPRQVGSDLEEADLTGEIDPGVAGAERFETLFRAPSQSPAPTPTIAPAPRPEAVTEAPSGPASTPEPMSDGAAGSLFDDVDALFGDSPSTEPAVVEPPAPRPTEPEAPKPLAQSPGGASVILLVEDEISVRGLFARDLRNRGYTVLEAESGEDGLEVLENLEQPIDLLLSDVQMPGMNGPTMLRRLGAKRPGLKVIFMSGFTSEAFAETLESAFDTPREYGFLTKPVSLAQLRARVASELADG